jgi:hypothetical protein
MGPARAIDKVGVIVRCISIVVTKHRFLVGHKTNWTWKLNKPDLLPMPDAAIEAYLMMSKNPSTNAWQVKNRPWVSIRCVFQFFGCLVLALAFGPAVAEGDALSQVETKIAARFDIPEVTVPDAKKALHTDPERWLVFDVRETTEFAVSRLPHARQVDPSISAKTFVRQFGDEIAGKQLLLY